MKNIDLIKNSLDYKIKLDNGGANFMIFATNIAKSYYDERLEKIAIYSKDIFYLDEIFVFPYLYFFLEPHFDISIQNRLSHWLEDDGWVATNEDFEWWGQNYYTYDSLNLVFNDINEILILSQIDFDNPKLEAFKTMLRKQQIDYNFLNKFYPELQSTFKHLTTNEQNIFIQKHLPIIINLYQQIIARIQKMINNNPNCQFICFEGP